MESDSGARSILGVAGGVVVAVAVVALAGGLAFPQARWAWWAGCGIAMTAGGLGLWPLARAPQRPGDRAVSVLSATAVRFGVVAAGLILAVVLWPRSAKWVVGGAGTGYLATLVVETIWTMRRK